MKIMILSLKFPRQDLQPPFHIVPTLLSEFQYLHFNDSHFSQDILTNMTNTLFPKSDDFFNVDIPPTTLGYKCCKSGIYYQV